MLARVQVVWEWLSTSLWFLPALMTVAAVAFGALAARLHVPPAMMPASAWWLNTGTAADASRLLSSLLTALVTMATLAYSITMVVLTLAAGQLGPRLIRSFMSDRRTQFMLGVYLGSIAYFVWVLRILRADMPEPSVPHLAVTFATLLFLLSVFTLVLFIHHLARSIVSDTVIARVGTQLDHEICRQLPERGPEDAEGTEAEPDTAGWAAICLPRGGYVQTVAIQALVDAAAACDVAIVLEVRPGHHVLAGGRLGLVSHAGALEKGLREAIQGSILIGAERTPVQDMEYSVRQLVEVALRALSPGINDPFTAIAVVDRLAQSLALLMQRAEPRRVWRDGDGIVRLTLPVSGFDGIADAAFNQIRQSAEGHADVLIRLIEGLGALAEHTHAESQRAALRRHVRMAHDAAHRTLGEPADLAVVDARRDRAAAWLGPI